jgi:DNA topoisomerase-1
MNEVIVVESGAKTKTIRQFLRGEYDVVACGGHIMDLPEDELGIDVENDFEYRVEPITYQGKSKVETVRDKLEGADRIYLGTDPDREGEAIASDLKEHCVPYGAEVRRIEFNAIVYHAVKEAMDNPREIYDRRVEAQRARRALDRLIGFIISAMAQFDPEGPGCPSVGRVLSPAVSLVVDRESEIDAFEPRNYWTLHASLTHEDEELTADLEGEWEDFDETKETVQRLRDIGSATVTDCEETPDNEFNPRPPYTTDALQDEADYLLGFTPDKTMRLAQELYQGVEIDGRSQALITYMRTDSTRVSPSGMSLAEQALEEREELGGDLYKGRPWRPQGEAQDAHEAIRPTMPEDPDFFPKNLKGELEDDHLELYRLIYIRFLCSQMKPAVYHSTELKLDIGDQSASAVGHRLKEKGFLKLYHEVHPDHGYEEVDLPALEEGTELPVERVWPEPQETRSPARYREGSLVRELKNRGIGRPSTYGDILSKIKRGQGGFGYVRKVRRTLRPTDRGQALCQYLHDRYPEVINYEYTAGMEEELEKIEHGENSYEEFLRQEFEWLREPYEHVKEKGWLSGDRPTPAQVRFLKSLARETETEVPEEVLKSKDDVSEWIDRLQEEQDHVITLTDIREVDVGGVDCFRFRLKFNKPLPDEEKEFLKEHKMKYKSGGQDRVPAYQFQRQDYDVVEELWDTLRERYSGSNSPVDAEFEVET